ncbi:MAG TPA: hypothetical protein PKE19_07875 [Aestuariivirga sp.]|nr:hypothetical protein [Aestuariivirga sp.]
MTMRARWAVLLCLGLVLSGCTSLKRMTGQVDDTVLPGTREDVLPPEQQTRRDPAVTGDKPATGECVPDDVNCLPPVDQEAPGAAQ